MLIVEKRKDETNARIKDVSVRTTTNEAPITELGDNINRSRSAYSNANRRIDDIDAHKKLTSQLHSLDARINCSLSTIRSEEVLSTKCSVAIFNLDGLFCGDMDKSFNEIFGEFDPTVDKPVDILKDLGSSAKHTSSCTAMATPPSRPSQP